MLVFGTRARRCPDIFILAGWRFSPGNNNDAGKAAWIPPSEPNGTISTTAIGMAFSIGCAAPICRRFNLGPAISGSAIMTAPPTPGLSAPRDSRRGVETEDPIGRGSQYLLVIAAASPDIFFDPHHPDATAGETQTQLAKRKEHRSAVFIEETRVSGPDWYRHLPGSGAPPAIQLGNYQTRNEADDLDLAIWYRQMKTAAGDPRARLHRRPQAGLRGWLAKARHPL